MTNSSRYLSDLHQQIDRLFSMEDVRTMCFNLGVDFDNVTGEGKSARIRELLLQLARRSELQMLVDLARRDWPKAVWADVPAEFTLPSNLATPDKEPPVNDNYYGPLSTYNQQDQKVDTQINSAGNVTIGHLGNDVSRNMITVGNISGASVVAIGSEARASVNTTTNVTDGSIDDSLSPPESDLE